MYSDKSGQEIKPGDRFKYQPPGDSSTTGRLYDLDGLKVIKWGCHDVELADSFFKSGQDLDKHCRRI